MPALMYLEFTARCHLKKIIEQNYANSSGNAATEKFV
jgi:hypothetical protein